MSEINKQNIGNAGEYYFAARLSTLDFTVTLTLGRAERYDIIAISPSGKTFKISVKTSYKENVSRFPLSKKDALYSDDTFYYVFVAINKFKTEPDFWIIPSLKVTKVLKYNEKQYFELSTKRDGTPHLDVGIRNLRIKFTDKNRSKFPKGFETELTNYYKNFSPLLQ